MRSHQPSLVFGVVAMVGVAFVFLMNGGSAEAPGKVTAQQPPPAASAPGRQLYVAPHGDDQAPGTATAPFRQISRAASVATPGTVVLVRPGTYGPVRSGRHGTNDARIVFRSEEKWRAKVIATGHTNAWFNEGDWTTIEGFDISGSQYAGIVSTASYGRFEGNYIHDLRAPDCSRGGAGIEMQTYTGRGNDSISNVVHDMSTPGHCELVHGIYYQSPLGGTIVGNDVRRTDGWGIHLWHNANRITIKDNQVLENRAGGILVGGSLEGNDIRPGIASGVVVVGNTVGRNGGWGIQELGRVGSNIYSNNTVYDNEQGDIRLLSASRSAF